MFLVNYGLVRIITSETELEIFGHVCAKVLIEKGFFDRKGREMHLGYLESKTDFEAKKRHCLSTGLINLQDKSKIKIK